MDHVLNLHIVLLLVVFVLLLSAPYCEGLVHVVGPSQPIMATVGDEVILPCQLEPATKASGLTVEWARPDLNPRFVYVWRDGVELESKTHPSYKRRTKVFPDEQKLGDVSLNLSKVKFSDGGTYKCFIPGHGDALIQLVVGAVNSPFIVSINISSSGVVLQCESEGWYPEPEVLWLDGEGNLLSAGPTETVRGPDDLYTVSSRVTVEKRHSNSFTCRVQQKNINQTRETHIHIAADFFTVPPSSSVRVNIGIIALIIFILCSLAVAFAWWKWKTSRQTL
ncbi:butyrophilin subfamily 1 member A1-like isoform X2 [Sander lucioperca]|uniref:butyrophilin subfamily 1 member A1-like isoform X2 n=1 Tax=Sander lucioperca TaxID=283035 RepID=UPI00125CF3E4|nr:butyrophilin subfamily 1 member A1-like isoform X2 [Sander lucioperca]